MTTLQQIELQCPICETRFRSQSVVSTNSFGGKRTDFHERAAGTQPLPYLIHTCNRCGYSGADRDFTEEADVSPVLQGACVERARAVHHLRHADGLREVRSRSEGRGVAGNGSAPRGRSAAARCVVLRGRGRHRSRALLPRRRRGSSRRRSDSFDGVARDERAVLTYLVGELWRRVGDTKLATAGSIGWPRKSWTRRRSSGSSMRRANSGIVRGSGLAEP